MSIRGVLRRLLAGDSFLAGLGSGVLFSGVASNWSTRAMVSWMLGGGFATLVAPPDELSVAEIGAGASVTRVNDCLLVCAFSWAAHNKSSPTFDLRPLSCLCIAADDAGAAAMTSWLLFFLPNKPIAPSAAPLSLFSRERSVN